MSGRCRLAGPAAQRRLRPVYRATAYRVHAAVADFDIRIGERCAPLDRLLTAAGCRCWAFVTACNPASQLSSDRDNRRRQRRLRALLRARGALLVPAHGVSDAGDWPPEPSVLALGLAEREALAVALAFEQYAVVCGRRGSRARLRWA